MKKYSTNALATEFKISPARIISQMRKLKIKPYQITHTDQQMRYLWKEDARTALGAAFTAAVLESMTQVAPAVVAAPASPPPAATVPAMQQVKDKHIANLLVRIESKLDTLTSMVRSQLPGISAPNQGNPWQLPPAVSRT